tara:strand:- start:238062 stop:239288 length:1227 start_codon:yes stop_codon:yes gene_type:complete
MMLRSTTADANRPSIASGSTVLGFVFAFSILSRSALLILVAVIPARVTMNSGETLKGALVEINESAIVFQSETGSAELAFDDVLSLSPIERDEATGPTSRVTLVGGSKIAAQDFSLTGETLTIEPRRQDVVKVPVKQVRSIRFRVASPLTDPQWLGLMDKPLRRDLLVIRRDGDRLDPTEGIVESIGGGFVGFNLDGETVDAPTDRLEGVVFGGAAIDPNAASIQVTDRYGSKWMARSVRTSQDSKSLEIEINDALTHRIPLSHLDSIRWSGGLTLLAAQQPAAAAYTPYLKTEATDGLMRDWFGPSPVGDSDMLLIGDSSIEYRLDDGFQTFAGAVRRDEVVDQAGDVMVRIVLDGEQVWNEELSGGETLGFEIPAAGAKRLKIQVDSGDDGDVGDRVILLRPRMLK